MKSTELNLIPFFVAVYEESSMSKAANRLGVSQPAVSKALKRLREIYDDPLFHRSPAGVKPTTFATDIYPALSASFKNFTSTLTATRDFDPKVSERIFSIACITLVGYQLMPELLKKVKSLAPNIDLDVHPLFTEDHESDLRLQRYDLVLDMRPTEKTSLKVEKLGTESIRAIVRKDHPRLSGAITVEAFLQEEHIAVSRWQSRSSFLSNHHFPEPNKRKIVYRSPGILEVLPVVSSTDYIALFPNSMLKQMESLYPIQVLEAPFVEISEDICMLWHASRTSEAGHKWLRTQILSVSKNMFND
ncbi:LysR family transcriptional regulator [Vibrio sp. UCD-FRSSP16_10]|uniref:LysR family transcriptional regulator n=1 Tax=unclassified Vibrio TaxID=2614977 RepID=UPI0008021F44|nr:MULTISPECIES: LysR family transcriptional regulator [unclassified Vibrio]OBT13261.1 LysR family transcriptional regulator [Vibrio sp. UCD-FRSSP16_30]OBT19611.1 LysR family transcriptional regulator [Vibrio sp. UCD-FRSSP16_10]